MRNRSDKYSVQVKTRFTVLPQNLRMADIIQYLSEIQVFHPFLLAQSDDFLPTQVFLHPFSMQRSLGVSDQRVSQDQPVQDG